MINSAVVLLSISFVLPVLVYVVEPLESQSPGLSFIGSFHPMVLHFPIALLCVIPLFEVLRKYRSFQGIEPVVMVLLLVSCVSALFTASLGLLLYLSGEYSGQTILYHRWLGVAFPLLCCLLFLVRIIGGQRGRLSLYYTLLIAALAQARPSRAPVA